MPEDNSSTQQQLTAEIRLGDGSHIQLTIEDGCYRLLLWDADENPGSDEGWIIASVDDDGFLVETFEVPGRKYCHIPMNDGATPSKMETLERWGGTMGELAEALEEEFGPECTPFRAVPLPDAPGTILCTTDEAPSWTGDFLGFKIDGLPEKYMAHEVARRVAAALNALNAAEESRDRPWVGEGPTPEEAGGQSILVRIGEDLERGYWAESHWRSLGGGKPTGWRPMPKA